MQPCSITTIHPSSSIHHHFPPSATQTPRFFHPKSTSATHKGEPIPTHERFAPAQPPAQFSCSFAQRLVDQLQAAPQNRFCGRRVWRCFRNSSPCWVLQYRSLFQHCPSNPFHLSSLLTDLKELKNILLFKTLQVL